MCESCLIDYLKEVSMRTLQSLMIGFDSSLLKLLRLKVLGGYDTVLNRIDPFNSYNDDFGTPKSGGLNCLKVLYGCPVSGKRWHDDVVSKIKQLGYKRSVIDHCLFVRNVGEHVDIIVVYADDLLVLSTAGTSGANEQLDELNEMYDIKKLGKAIHILGIGIHRSSEGIALEQKAYIQRILNELEYENIKPKGTPCDAQYKGKDELLDTKYITLYQRIHGQFMYLTNCTRPDISFTVGRLASRMKAPTNEGWERMKRLIRYVNGTKDLGLKYKKSENYFTLEAYVDASYGSDLSHGKSITGFVIQLNGAPIGWRSHLQSTLADSPNAAECIALHEAATTIIGLNNLIGELKIKIKHPPTLYEDNDGARKLATCGMGNKRARHLSMKLHYLQELCEKGEIKILRIGGKEQPTDILTKGLHTIEEFTYLRETWGDHH